MDDVRASVHAWCTPHVSWPLLHVRMQINFLFIYFISLKSAVHRHEGGTYLGTCLVNTTCVVGFVACVNADKFSVMYLILLKSLMHEYGRYTRLGTCLVYTPSFVAFVACEHANKFSVYVLHFIEVSCARAWTRQAPWYVPCALAACILCREFVACTYLLMCWL